MPGQSKETKYLEKIGTKQVKLQDSQEPKDPLTKWTVDIIFTLKRFTNEELDGRSNFLFFSLVPYLSPFH